MNTRAAEADENQKSFTIIVSGLRIEIQDKRAAIEIIRTQVEQATQACLKLRKLEGQSYGA
eukprot:SAG31_NODE_19532_length_599_cov_1.034000_2_plen_60_part_01